MDRESTRRLRLDRRLIRRRGWISDVELERELGALPDVAHKIAPADGGPAGEGSGEPGPPESSEPPSPE
jgi:hypothetical protein